MRSEEEHDTDEAAPVYSSLRLVAVPNLLHPCKSIRTKSVHKHTHICVRAPSCKVSGVVRLYPKLEYIDYFSYHPQILNFMKIRPAIVELRTNTAKLTSAFFPPTFRCMETFGRKAGFMWDVPTLKMTALRLFETSTDTVSQSGRH